jgi:5-methylcytosine-specific restriction endonuclease McrA
MIRINKGPIPETIVIHGPTWTAVWIDHVENGTPISSIDKSRYRRPEIKSSIVEETFGKCAYCESKVTHTYPGDVEHILPKRKRPDLFVTWGNLTLACSVCNTKKGDYYDANQPLLNPYVDDPADHLRFHGPLLFHVPGSNTGEVTRLLLDLSRAGLFERRRERIEALNQLIDRWSACADGGLRALLLGEIKKELADDREYAAALRAFARDHAGIRL